LYKIELAGLEVDAPAVEHIPVLAETLAEQINLPTDGVMVDATIGQGGHSFLFGSKLGPEGIIVAEGPNLY
jgi:16S rRNA C1402 N4-methylase RsmH